jgi:hypothetical protein
MVAERTEKLKKNNKSLINGSVILEFGFAVLRVEKQLKCFKLITYTCLAGKIVRNAGD